jgi:dephospho-CoA kinase
MKVFITSSSGVGKSAVVNELVNRGYTTFDADDIDLNLTCLVIRETGEAIEWHEGSRLVVLQVSELVVGAW